MGLTAALTDAEFIGYMVVTIPCFILYVLVLVVLLRPVYRNLFHDSYFKLTVLIALDDLFLYVIFNLEYRFLMYPPTAALYKDLPPESFFLRFIFFWAYFLRYFKGSLVLSTSVNRLTAVVYFRKHETIWRYLFWISILGCLGISLYLSWYYFICTIDMKFLDQSKTTYGLSPQLALFSPNSAANLATFGIVCGACDLFVNVLTCASLVFQKTQNVAMNKMLLGLTVITLIEFGIQALTFGVENGLLYYMSQRIFTGPFNDLYFAMCWITDLSTLLKPFMLILISTSVRHAFFETYNVCKHKTVVHSFVTVQPLV